MAPEQARGLTADTRSDIFAVGAILYEMLSGERAFHGTSPADTISAILKDEPPSLSRRGIAVPPALLRILNRCLEKEAGDRFQTARDLAFAVESISDSQEPPVREKPSEKSIAVLPFSNMGGDADQEYFSDGLAEELINALAGLSGLRVASRTSAFRFRGRDLERIYQGLQKCLAEGVSGCCVEIILGSSLDKLEDEPRFRELFSRFRLVQPRPRL
jgi:serine/threonine protein kinase